MKVLLDTQAFLWLVLDQPALSKQAKKIFLNTDNQLFLSIASMWEIAIKTSIGKLHIHQPIERFIPSQLQENGITQLDINFRHVAKVATLPFHHRDPFDRLIISQAMEEKWPILSIDTAFDNYPVKRLW
jgi:PIN domain nuclease of toxin-antitoxin system